MLVQWGKNQNLIVTFPFYAHTNSSEDPGNSLWSLSFMQLLVTRSKAAVAT